MTLLLGRADVLGWQAQAPAGKRPPASAVAPKAKAWGSFETLVQRAAAARQAERIEEAISLYKQALLLRPAWDEGWWYLGTMYYDTDRYAEALPAFRSLISINPRMGQAWALMGLCEFETKDYKNSLIHLQKGRNIGLGNSELVNVTRYHQALILDLRGEFEAAMELLTSLVGQGVLSIDVKKALGVTLLRVPMLPEQIDPSKDALVHTAGEAAALIAQNSFDQAEIVLRQMLKDYPQTSFLHFAYGGMLSRLSRFDDAEKEFQLEIEVTPDSAMAPMELAYVYLRIKREKDALPLAQKAVQLAPQSFAAHYLLGRTMLELGSVAASIKELETARRLGPFSPEIHYSLARAYAKAKRPQEAGRERAEFARLSAVLEQKQRQTGPQSYRSSSERGELGPRVAGDPAAPPN